MSHHELQHDFDDDSDDDLKAIINAAWEQRSEITPQTDTPVRQAVDHCLEGLDSGALRVAEKIDGRWHVHEWLKKAVLLSFRLNANRLMGGGPCDHEHPGPVTGPSGWYDKVAPKSVGWSEDHWKKAGYRAVPPATVRYASHVAQGVVLMPCFVNIGAYVDRGSMIDTWATVGSCAQIGRDCHISGGAGIGGVLEPLQAAPVIIEDDCFIGARSEIAEGVIVETGSVISMGVYIGASTKIIDRASGEISYGRVPAYSVVVPGTLPGRPLADGSPGPGLYCAVIVKQVDEKTRKKTSINDLLRA